MTNNSNGNGSVVEGSSQFVSVSLRNVSVRGNFVRSALDFALLVNSSVGVFRLSGDSVVFDVFESEVHQSSVASHVSIRSRTVHQLLF